VRIVFVCHGDVVEDVFLCFQHAARAVLDDRGELVAEAGIEGPAVRNRGGDEVRRAVLMLQALAGERGAPRGTADEEAART
jgi:hypothetical protein